MALTVDNGSFTAHAENILKTLNKCRKSHELCDAVLVVEGHRIPVHSLLLSLCTPYFHNLLKGANSYLSVKELRLGDFDHQTIQLVLDYCYTANVSLDSFTVWSLLPAACTLQLDELKAMCCEYLRSRLSVVNVLQTRQAATSSSCPSLVGECVQFIQKNFSRIFSQQSFLDSAFDEFHGNICSLFDILSLDQMVEVTVGWFKHKLDKRIMLLDMFLQKLPDCPLKLRNALRQLSNQAIPKVQSPTQMPRSLPSFTHLNPKYSSPSLSRNKLPVPLQGSHSSNIVFPDFNDPWRRNQNVTGPTPGSENFNTEYAAQGDDPSCVLVKSELPANDSDDFDSINFLTPCICVECNKTFHSPIELHHHMKTHEKNYVCKICYKCFNNKPSLVCHAKVHSDEKPHRCEICGQGFKEKNNLITHIRRHTGEKPFPCKVCGKQFSHKSNVTRHMSVHARPFVCLVCGIGFWRSLLLTAHMAHNHPDMENKVEFPQHSDIPLHMMIDLPNTSEDDQVRRRFSEDQLSNIISYPGRGSSSVHTIGSRKEILYPENRSPEKLPNDDKAIFSRDVQFISPNDEILDSGEEDSSYCSDNLEIADGSLEILDKDANSDANSDKSIISKKDVITIDI